MTPDAHTVLGVVMAGGASTRFGSPKALATVDGERIVDRAVAALRAATDMVVSISNDAALGAVIGLPCRTDVLADAGALAGVHAGLCWARERGDAGILAVACDMPFLSAALLRRLAAGLAQGYDAVLPRSGGRRGVEPLCAAYGNACSAAIEAAAARGDVRMIGFHDSVRVQYVELADVRSFGDPARLFLNVNTPADLEHARALASRPAARDGSAVDA